MKHLCIGLLWVLGSAGMSLALDVGIPVGKLAVDMDDTNAINAGIAQLSRVLDTGSGAQREGGTLVLPAGKINIGNPGAVAHCAGGVNDGQVCTKDGDCGSATSTMTNDGYCCWITSQNRPVQIVGQGNTATELLVKAGPIHTLCLGPGSNYSSIRSLRIAGFPKANGTGNAIVLLSQRPTIEEVTIDSIGGSGIFLDGNRSTFLANTALFTHVESNGNGQDGFRILSHDVGDPTAPPTGVGDGSQHTFVGCTANENKGWGVRLNSSKQDGRVTTNKNTLGGVLIAGSSNQLAVYCEIGNQPECVEMSGNDNVITDISRASWTPGKYVDTSPGQTNQWCSGFTCKRAWQVGLP